MAYRIRQNFRTEPVSPGLFTLVSGTNCVSQDEEGLLIDTKSFNTIIDLEPHRHADSDKFVVSINPKIDVRSIPPGEEMKFEVVMSGKQFFRQPNATLPIVPSVFINRIRNIYEDPRLCCSSMGIYDPETLLAFKFLITDNMIYAYYGRERTSVEVHAEKPLAAFISLIPLQKRGVIDIDDPMSKLRMFHRLTIGVHITTHREIVVVWYINGDRKFSINTPGHRIADQYQVLDQGGVSQTIEIKEFVMQLGHHSFLDFQLPNNYSRDKIVTVNHGGFPVHRSCSGLVQLMESKMYREIFPDFFGNNVEIDASKSFAVPFDAAAANISNRVFGQGMISRLKELSIYISRRNRNGRDSEDREFPAPVMKLPPVREDLRQPPPEFRFNMIEPPAPSGPSAPMSQRITRTDPDYVKIDQPIPPHILRGVIPHQGHKKRPALVTANRPKDTRGHHNPPRDPFMAVSSDIKKESTSDSSSSKESEEEGDSSVDLFPKARKRDSFSSSDSSSSSEEEESPKKKAYQRSEVQEDSTSLNSKEMFEGNVKPSQLNPPRLDQSVKLMTYNHPPFDFDESYSRSDVMDEDEEDKPVYAKDTIPVYLGQIPKNMKDKSSHSSKHDNIVESDPKPGEVYHTPTASPGSKQGSNEKPTSSNTSIHTPTEPKDNNTPDSNRPPSLGSTKPSLETPEGVKDLVRAPSLESIKGPPSLETPKIHSQSIGDEVVPSYSQRSSKLVNRVQIPVITSDYNSPPSLESVDLPERPGRPSGSATSGRPQMNIKICWWCRHACGGTCCSGQCGSEHCISYRNLSGRKYNRY